MNFTEIKSIARKCIGRQMNTTGQVNARYNGFDIAKFIMAIFVVTLHAHPFSDISFGLNYIITNGLTRVAVPYFFMVSGFLLFRKMSLYELDIAKIKRYLIHIFRLYVIWTIIYLPIIIYTGILKPHKGFLSGGIEILKNIIYDRIILATMVSAGVACCSHPRDGTTVFQS